MINDPELPFTGAAILRHNLDTLDVDHLYWLLAQMCWPEDPERRKAFFAYYVMNALDYAMATHPSREGTDPEKPGGIATLNELVHLLFGGWKAMFDFPRSQDILADFGQRLREGRHAGATLYMADLLRDRYRKQVPKEKVSLTSIRDFFSNGSNSFFDEKLDPNRLAKEWRTYKLAAPLWGGFFFVWRWMPGHIAQTAKTDAPLDDLLASMDVEHLTPLASLFARAIMTMGLRLQKFGTTFTSKRSGKPMLALEPEWTLAPSLWLNTEFPEVTLTDADIARFNAYVAAPS